MGWSLAYYQWFRNMRFTDMRERGLSADEILKRYRTLHEADISKFVEVADFIVESHKQSSSI